jgi:hypothetical protein
MIPRQLSEYFSRLSSTVTPKARWTAVSLGLLIGLIVYLLQPKDNTIPDNVKLKIEAVPTPY